MFLFSVQLIAILSVILLAVGHLKAAPRDFSARVFGILAFCVVLYLLNGLSAPHISAEYYVDTSSMSFLIDIAQEAIPGLFMIYCFHVFQEQRYIPSLLQILFGLQVILEAATALSGFPSTVESFTYGMAAVSLEMFLNLLQLVFIGFAIYWTIKGWRADLIEDRRVLRWLVIVVQGGLILVVNVTENFLLTSGTINDVQAQLVIVTTIATAVLVMLISTMQMNFVSLGQRRHFVKEVSLQSSVADQAEFDIDTFKSQFCEPGLYKEAGLTIAGLASRLKVPEYRLRAFIHQTLGFRNFNAMLHHYRIKDACKTLADAQNQNVPVLTIALKVGYQSITPFNNAFREIKGVTPSEYRKKKVPNS